MASASIGTVADWTRRNWFVPLAGLGLAVAWWIGRFGIAADPMAMEAALIADMCLTLPLFYAVCYAGTRPAWQIALRMIAIACLGIYFLNWAIPPSSQTYLPSFALLRYCGLAVLVVVELRVMIAAIRLVFGSNATASEVATTTGVPPFIAKLMVLEARLWKSVFSFLRRRR